MPPYNRDRVSDEFRLLADQTDAKFRTNLRKLASHPEAVRTHDELLAHSCVYGYLYDRHFLHNPELLLNVHYLTSEQIHVRGDEADGQWVHCQPWIFSDGSSLLRSSRLNNQFRKVDGAWRISRTRTENVFVAPLKPGWAETFARSSVLMR